MAMQKFGQNGLQQQDQSCLSVLSLSGSPLQSMPLCHHLKIQQLCDVAQMTLELAIKLFSGSQLVCITQVVIAVGVRPKAFSHRRRYWNVAHWNLGRIVLVLGIINLYIGMHAYGVSAGYYIALSVVLAFFLVVAVIKDSIDIISMPPVALVPEGDRERAIYSNQPLMTRGDRYYAESNKNAGPGGHALGTKRATVEDTVAPGPAVNV